VEFAVMLVDVLEVLLVVEFVVEFGELVALL
jgi:hypothetical protein